MVPRILGFGYICRPLFFLSSALLTLEDSDCVFNPGILSAICNI